MTVSEKLRLVQGLHSHAEMFGFNWNDGSDWTWHDVACKIADEIDAENAKLRKLAAGVGHLLFTLDVDYCATCPRDGINHPCPVYTVVGGECLYKTDLRELGVEVDG